MVEGKKQGLRPLDHPLNGREVSQRMSPRRSDTKKKSVQMSNVGLEMNLEIRKKNFQMTRKVEAYLKI